MDHLCLDLAEDFVYITDNTYTKDELLQMDRGRRVDGSGAAGLLFCEKPLALGQGFLKT